MKYLRKVKWIFILLLLVGLSTAYRYDDPAYPGAKNEGQIDRGTRSLWDRARNSLHQGNYDQAISILEKLISSGDNKIAESSCFLLADCYFYKYKPTLIADFLTVLKMYQTAIQRYPHSMEVPRAYLQLGLVYQQLDYTYEALAYFNLVEKNYKNSPYASYTGLYKGRLYLAKQELSKARQEFEKVISAFPHSQAIDDTYLNLIGLCTQEGSFDRAAEGIDQLQKLRPDAFRTWPVLFFYQGQVRMAAKQYAQARTDLLRYVNINPYPEKDDLAIYNVGDAYEREGKIQEAMRLFSFLTQAYPQSEGAILARYRLIERLQIPGQVISKQASFDEGVYLTLLEKCRKHAIAEEAMARLVLRYYAAGRTEQTVSWMSRFMEAYPSSPLINVVIDAGSEALITEAKNLYGKRKYVEIITLYHKNSKLAGRLRDGRFPHYLASAFNQLSFYDQASYFYQQANGLGVGEEDAGHLLLDWATSDQQRRDYRSAEILLQRLISKCTDKSILEDAEQKLGENYALAGDWKAGMSYFSQLYRKGACSNPILLYSWARCTLGSGAHEQTRDILKLLAPALNSKGKKELVSQTVDLWIKLGDDEKNRNTQQAIKDYLCALALDVQTAKKNEIHYRLGNCYAALGLAPSAEAEFTAIRQAGDVFWKKVAEGKLKGMKVSKLISERKIVEN